MGKDEDYIELAREKSRRDLRAWQIKQGRKEARRLGKRLPVGESSVAPSGGGGFWGGLKGGFARAAGERIASSGGSSGGGSGGGSGPNAAKIVPLLVIILLLGGCTYLFAIGDDSGFWQNKLGVKLKDPVDTVKDTVVFIGRQLSKTAGYIKGENLADFSLEEKTTSSKKSGLELEDVKIIGGIFNDLYVGGDLAARTILTVNELPDNLEPFEVDVSCYLDDINGDVSTGEGYPAKNKKVLIVNPKEGGREEIPIDCIISEDKFKASLDKDSKKVYYKKNIKFEAVYSREGENSERIYLPIFIIPDREIYNEYRGKENKAFDELARGDYSSYRSSIPSEMRYKSDASAIMNFNVQPLGIREEPYQLYFKFKNNLGNKGNISFGGFRISFPAGFDLQSCNYLDNYGVLKIENKKLNEQLNSPVKETRVYWCDVFVNEAALQDTQDNLVRLDPNVGLNARFAYASKLIKEREISFGRMDTEEEPSDATGVDTEGTL